MIKRAKKKLMAIIDSGVGVGGVRRATKLSRQYGDFIHITLGFHPVDAEKARDELIKGVLKEIEEKIDEVVGIGETGMDFYHTRNLEGRRKQEKIFRTFAELAVEYQLPLVIHARNCEKQAFRIIKEYPLDNVIFHCYSGNLDTANEIIQEGYHLSFSTMICFIDHHKKLIKNLPLENILTETDSPYLSPFKGGRNEPAFVEEAVKVIAEVKGLNFKDVDRITTQNAKRIFKI